MSHVNSIMNEVLAVGEEGDLSSKEHPFTQKNRCGVGTFQGKWKIDGKNPQSGFYLGMLGLCLTIRVICVS